MNKMYKVFTVIIHNKEYDVWDIQEKKHHGLNNTIDTWWLYYSDRLPEEVTPPIDSDHWEPYCVGINRRCWDIRFRQHNTSKLKWDEHDFRNVTIVDMYCNNKLVYQFSTTGNDSGLAFAMNKVGYLKTMLSEHCYDFFNTDKMKGRKIWWYGLPATIQPRESETWEIKVYPDYSAGLTKEEWWKEYKHRKTKLNAKPDPDWDEVIAQDDRDDEHSGYINWGDAFEDGHIDWFRD